MGLYNMIPLNPFVLTAPPVIPGNTPVAVPPIPAPPVPVPPPPPALTTKLTGVPIPPEVVPAEFEPTPA